MRKNRKFEARSIAMSAIFALVCIMYIIRLVNIKINAEPENETGEYYQRRETIQTQRGEIYDRNGKKLVSNKYTYNFVFDYAAMSGDKTEQNVHLLQAVYAMQNMGIYDDSGYEEFPFSGSYPNYSYTTEALSSESNTYYKLLKRIAENELEDESPKAKNQLTADYLEEFYEQNPGAFPKESEIINFYLERYKLVNSKGELTFDEEQTDLLLRLRYSMEVADFGVYNRYVMASDVDREFILYIEELCLPGADFEKVATRVYEYPGYASHILGRTGKIYAENWEYYKELGYDMDDIVGIDGCEYAFENYLRGVDGVMLITEDKDGNIISKKIEQEPIPGQDIYLTIDIDLQIAAEDGLKATDKSYGYSESGACVAVDPNNGEVLVLASYPTYDLTTFGVDYNDLASDSRSPLLNKALDGLYAPGSTYKLGVTAAAMYTGEITPTTLIECKGVYTDANGHKSDCWIYNSSSATVAQHGNITASEAICVSCNCFFYRVGEDMGTEKMNAYISQLGFGSNTGIELSEKVGQLDESDAVHAAIGQAQHEVTPIQLASYLSTLINGGTRYSAHLLYKTSSFSESGGTYVKETEILGTVEMSAETLSTIKLGMKRMVENNATVRRNMSDVHATVYGKTGTAEKGTGKVSDGLFVCAAQSGDTPEIVVATVLSAAGTGNYASLASSYVLKAYYQS